MVWSVWHQLCSDICLCSDANQGCHLAIFTAKHYNFGHFWTLKSEHLGMGWSVYLAGKICCCNDEGVAHLKVAGGCLADFCHKWRINLAGLIRTKVVWRLYKGHVVRWFFNVNISQNGSGLHLTSLIGCLYLCLLMCVSI